MGVLKDLKHLFGIGEQAINWASNELAEGFSEVEKVVLGFYGSQIGQFVIAAATATYPGTTQLLSDADKLFQVAKQTVELLKAAGHDLPLSSAIRIAEIVYAQVEKAGTTLAQDLKALAAAIQANTTTE